MLQRLQELNPNRLRSKVGDSPLGENISQNLKEKPPTILFLGCTKFLLLEPVAREKEDTGSA